MKLSIKGDRANSPKSALLRKPYRPGQHGKTRGRRKVSEFGTQLREKQKLKFSYGLNERQVANVFAEAFKKPGVTSDEVLGILESRLDNVIYRLGFAPSRSSSKQIVGHGHITVNGRKVTIPSLRVRVGDKIGVREQSRNHGTLKDLPEKLKGFEAPAWLRLDPVTLSAEVLAKPLNVPHVFYINIVVDYYS
mgnify:FL=1